MRLARSSLTAAAIALAAQVSPHLSDIWRDDYAQGAAWEPRVKAILDVSRVAARGGPYLSVPAGRGFEAADLKVNDLGFAALGYAWGRAFGQPLKRRTLMAVNLVILVTALLALFAVLPPLSRLLASLVLLLTPIPVPAYRSPDPLAVHGSLALLGVVIAASVMRRWPYWSYASIGLFLFVMHKIRSAYALYAAAALLAVAVIGAWRDKNRPPLLRASATLFTCFALEALWQVPLAARAADPRVSQQDTLGTHNIYIVLLEGVGWSHNRWGIKASDPWAATYLADRFGADPVNVGTGESERRARRAYFDLWLQEPAHLIAVYASRVPKAVADHCFGGTLGGLVLLVAMPSAAILGWRQSIPAGGLLLASAGVTLCLVFQTVVLDPRLIYAYPLRIASGLTLALASAQLLEALARRKARLRPSA